MPGPRSPHVPAIRRSAPARGSDARTSIADAVAAQRGGQQGTAETGAEIDRPDADLRRVDSSGTELAGQTVAVGFVKRRRTREGEVQVRAIGPVERAVELGGQGLEPGGAGGREAAGRRRNGGAERGVE